MTAQKKVRKRVKPGSTETQAKTAKPKSTSVQRSRIPTRRIDGLRGPQVRILDALADGGSLTRAEISKKAKVDNATLTGYLGSTDPEVRSKNDEQWHPSLIGQKLVKFRVVDEGGKDVPRYELTALGKKKQAK